MIQRVQTLFLIAIVICMTLMNFFPVWTEHGPDGSMLVMKTFGATQGGEVLAGWYFVPGILAVLAALVALWEIFSYKNRLTQVKLGALNALLITGAVVTAIYFIYQLEMLHPDTQGRYGIGLGFPMISLVCNLLANRFIRRDEKLVRSVDRIR